MSRVGRKQEKVGRRGDRKGEEKARGGGRVSGWGEEYRLRRKWETVRGIKVKIGEGSGEDVIKTQRYVRERGKSREERDGRRIIDSRMGGGRGERREGIRGGSQRIERMAGNGFLF